MGLAYSSEAESIIVMVDAMQADMELEKELNCDTECRLSLPLLSDLQRSDLLIMSLPYKSYFLSNHQTYPWE